MNTPFGTDTIRLYATPNEMQFEPGFDAELPNKTNHATGEVKYDSILCHTTDGQEVRGQSLDILTSNWQFWVRPGKDARTSAILQFSANAYRDDNLSPSNLEHVMDSISTMERELSERGIRWALDSAMVSCLAANRNPIMDEPIANYLPALAALNVRKRVKRNLHGETGQTVGNKSWDAVFYDKKSEMRVKGYDTSQCPDRVFRGELEWKKSVVLKKATGIKLVKDIPGNWENIEPAFNRVMAKEIFKSRNDEACEKSAFDISEVLADAASKPRPFSTSIHEIGLLFLIQSEGLERAKWLVSEQLGDTTTKAGKVVCDRWFRELEEAAARLELHKTSPSGASNTRLYRELKSKMMGES